MAKKGELGYVETKVHKSKTRITQIVTKIVDFTKVPIFRTDNEKLTARGIPQKFWDKPVIERHVIHHKVN
jgi:hypothetical protein